LSNDFFPQTIATAVMDSLHIAFYISAGLSAIAAVASFFTGKRKPHKDIEEQAEAETS